MYLWYTAFLYGHLWSHLQFKVRFQRSILIQVVKIGFLPYPPSLAHLSPPHTFFGQSYFWHNSLHILKSTHLLLVWMKKNRSTLDQEKKAAFRTQNSVSKQRQHTCHTILGSLGKDGVVCCGLQSFKRLLSRVLFFSPWVLHTSLQLCCLKTK